MNRKTESVESIRSAAQSQSSVVDVIPLGDSESDVLLIQAKKLESVGDVKGAKELMDQGLQREPSNPQLLQLRAELHLALRKYRQAMADATKAYIVGPQIGELCARSWRTTAAARGALRDVGGALAALDRAKACGLQAAPRL